ncbi:hypothetical protein SAY86_012339 [Trapa natans]|uniref:Uncharacterized protein n=1 Tax=Trapa natans TaxID=22666 RepID=A0AAN7RAJ4_TRANT|nr:hypothetical protein SAY86_012339 [Trapa natans]
MAEGAEADDRVILYKDNYMEDEDTEEQLDEDIGGVKHDVNPNNEEQDPESESGEEHQSPQSTGSHASGEPAVDEEERPAASMNGDGRDKHAELLSLPPHGSKVFIGGLPRDILEEDLRDLCEPNSEIFEFGKVHACDSALSWAFCLGSHLSFMCNLFSGLAS